MDNSTLVSVVKEALKVNGWKYSYVSEKTNINYQRLSRILNENAVMTADEFMRLCKLARINVEQIVSTA